MVIRYFYKHLSLCFYHQSYIPQIVIWYFHNCSVRKGVNQGYIISPCLFNFYAEYITLIAGLDDSQAHIKIARRNINNLRYADDSTLMAESKEELKSLSESERGEWKSWLKTQHSENQDHGIQSHHHFMTNRWGNNGNSWQTIFFGSKITADGDCSHEIRRHLLLGGKAMTNLDSILRNREITLPTKVHLVKTMVFPVIMYRCESWTIKEAERPRTDVSNCGAGEDSWESLGQQGDQTSQS